MLEESQILQIGPIQLPVKWVVLLLGLLFSTWVTEQIARRKGWEKERWSDLILTLVLIVIVSYKFGWILFDLKQVFQNPQMIIWTPGTNLSLGLGILIALVYSFIQVRKKELVWQDVLHFSWITFTITYFFFALLIKDYGKITTNLVIGISTSDQSSFHYHPVNFYRAVWLGILIAIRFSLWRILTFSKLMVLYIGLGFGMLVLSVFDLNNELILGMTVKQWMALIPVIVGSIGLLTKKEEVTN